MLGPGNTFCALAPGAMEPLQSALKYFREDFERYITGNNAAMESV
jgi:NADH-quinone oxidoreductase subunit F